MVTWIVCSGVANPARVVELTVLQKLHLSSTSPLCLPIYLNGITICRLTDERADSAHLANRSTSIASPP